MTERPTRRSVAIAGHTAEIGTIEAGWRSDDPAVRATALGAFERLRALTDERLCAALTDTDATVRRRAAELAAAHRDIDLVPTLGDPDPTVVEMAAWALGEHESNRAPIVTKLIELATTSPEPLVREAAVAALGAIGDPAAVDAIIAATGDKPAIRRRAVLALAPFEGAAVEAAIERALGDRDWQVRQAAEDLRRAQT